MTSPLAIAARTGALAAGVADNVDLPMDGSRTLCLILKNTGANAIGTVNVYKSPRGTLFAEDLAMTAAVGSLAAGASVLVELTDVAWATLRLRLTSASGTTYSVEMQGY